MVCFPCQYGRSALIGAAESGHLAIVEALLEYGVQVDWQNYVSLLRLHRCSSCG